MTTVSVHEAKTNLSALIAGVERLGEAVIICRHGRAVAELVPVPRGHRTLLDRELKKVRILKDPTTPTTEEWDDA